VTTRQPTAVRISAVAPPGKPSPAASSRASAGVVPRRTAARCFACSAVSIPSTATIWPPAAASASVPAPRPRARDGRMTASVSRSVSRNVPWLGTSPASVTSRASIPSPDRCTPIEAAVATASSNVAVDGYAERRVSRKSEAVFRQRCSSRRTISWP